MTINRHENMPIDPRRWRKGNPRRLAAHPRGARPGTATNCRAGSRISVTRHEKRRGRGEDWAIQERKGKARWQTISKGLTRKAGERQFDKLLSGLTDPRYTYRMIEE
ncbi:hypothetical protein ACNUI5_15970 [Pseudomonas aeruginosa]